MCMHLPCVCTDTAEYRDSGTHILRALDDVQGLFDDHIVKTQAMRGSPFVKPFENRVRDWEAKLITMQVVKKKKKTTLSICLSFYLDLSIYLSICIYISIYTSIYIYIYIYIYVYIYIYIYIYIYTYRVRDWEAKFITMQVGDQDLSIYLSICLSIYLSVYLSIFLSQVNRG